MEQDEIEEDDEMEECGPWVLRGGATAGASEKEEKSTLALT